MTGQMVLVSMAAFAMLAIMPPGAIARAGAPAVNRGPIAEPGRQVVLDQLGGFDPTIVALVIPLVLVQVAMLILAIADLLRDDRRVRGGNKGLWAVIIVFVNIVGPILYFLVGREEGPVEPTEPGPGAMPGWGSPYDPPIVAPQRPAPIVGTAGPLAGAAPTEEAGLPRPTFVPDPDAPPAIAIEGLTKRYQGGLLALDHLSMSVPEGSVFGLLGPNGAGKTTTLRLIAGLTRPTAGRAVVGGVPVEADSLAVRRRLGYLEQEPRGYGWMTGREQLRMLGRLHGLGGPELERSIAEALERVDLAVAADRRAGTYSGGMRQRLGIAGALVHRPPVVVLDEPVSSLDPEGRRDVLSLIAALRGATTVLFSTHVLADVERICDRVGILDKGQLVVEGTLADLLDRYALPVYRVEAEPGQDVALAALAKRLLSEPWVTGAGIEHGLLTVAVADPGRAAHELLPAIAAEGLGIISVARARPTLEDVFLRLTGGGHEVAA
jgi:ABC-2 type transport system ATP-binding protein